MEPNTNEATAPKRLKTGGKKPLIIIGVIVAVLLAAYVGLCAYANSLDTFYPNTTINGVDVAGLTAEQAAERLRQEIPEETVEFYLPLADETGDGESAPEGDMLYGADPDAVCTYRELGITEDLDYEASAQSAFDAVPGPEQLFGQGLESILPAWSEQTDAWASCWSRRRLFSRQRWNSSVSSSPGRPRMPPTR